MGIFLIVFMCPGVSKDKLGLGHGFKNPEVIEMRSFGLSHKEIKISLYQIEAELFPELLTYYSNIFSIKIAQKLPKQLPYCSYAFPNVLSAPGQKWVHFIAYCSHFPPLEPIGGIVSGFQQELRIVGTRKGSRKGDPGWVPGDASGIPTRFQQS